MQKVKFETGKEALQNGNVYNEGSISPDGDVLQSIRTTKSGDDYYLVIYTGMRNPDTAKTEYKKFDSKEEADKYQFPKGHRYYDEKNKLQTIK